MGCGCGKRFTKPSTPPSDSVLDEIARRMERDMKAAGIESNNNADEPAREAE